MSSYRNSLGGLHGQPDAVQDHLAGQIPVLMMRGLGGGPLPLTQIIILIASKKPTRKLVGYCLVALPLPILASDRPICIVSPAFAAASLSCHVSVDGQLPLPPDNCNVAVPRAVLCRLYVPVSEYVQGNATLLLFSVILPDVMEPLPLSVIVPTPE
jgi:hypothetical protein